MEPNVQNGSGMMNGMPPQQSPQAPHEKKVGPIVGVLIIVLALIIAGLYFFGQRLNSTSPADTTVPATSDTSSASTVPSAQAATTNTSASVSNADDVNSLNSDLNNQMNGVDYSF